MKLYANLRILAYSQIALGLALTACVQIVSPGSADLQKRASDMQAEVETWDLTMRSNAGTLPADPRHPDVEKKLNEWAGSIRAMATIAVGLDPNLIRCDAIVREAGKSIQGLLPASLRSAADAAPTATAQPAADANALPTGCEAALFQGMQRNLDDLIKVLKMSCQLPWLDEKYFAELKERRAAENAPNPPRRQAAFAALRSDARNGGENARSITSSAAQPRQPTAQEQREATANCAALFGGGAIAPNGPAVAPLLASLRAVVYVETRKKPADAAK